MARAVLTPVRPSMAGAAVALVAPTADGDAVPSGSGLLVNNTDISALTVTVVTSGTVNGLAIDDVTITVPATSMAFIGPFDGRHFPATTGATSGLVHVDYSRITGVTRAALDVG
jgi:hypothetical protein